MKIAAISMVSLRPLPLVVFTSNFLPDCWISHIEKPKEDATQMGEMGNTTSCALGGREELNQPEDDDHIFGRDGKKKIDVNRTIRKEPTEGKE